MRKFNKKEVFIMIGMVTLITLVSVYGFNGKVLSSLVGSLLAPLSYIFISKKELSV